jgi:hypothetical protein
MSKGLGLGSNVVGTDSASKIGLAMEIQILVTVHERVVQAFAAIRWRKKLDHEGPGRHQRGAPKN